MKVKVQAFGIAKDILQGSSVVLEVDAPLTVEGLQAHLLRIYPQFGGLASLRLAVNEAYAHPDTPIQETDEVVLIPPVSGG